jgi:hypothetical protein
LAALCRLALSCWPLSWHPMRGGRIKVAVVWHHVFAGTGPATPPLSGAAWNTSQMPSPPGLDIARPAPMRAARPRRCPRPGPGGMRYRFRHLTVRQYPHHVRGAVPGRRNDLLLLRPDRRRVDRGWLAEQPGPVSHAITNSAKVERPSGMDGLVTLPPRSTHLRPLRAPVAGGGVRAGPRRMKPARSARSAVR